jgi:integrase/recombinase XerC/integrase/recombinase XerD
MISDLSKRITNMKELSVKNETVTIGSVSSSLISRFLSYQDIKENSKETYRKALKYFFEWIGEENIHKPTREDILAYKRFLETNRLSSLTLSNYLVAVRRFFEWCEGIKLYPNIAKNIKGARRSRHFRKEPLTVEQIRELLSHIDCSTIQGKRDYAMINLMLRTGLRTHEVIQANAGDIRQQAGETLLYIHGKNRDDKDEFVLLTQETLNPLYEYLQTRGKIEDKAPLFVSLSDRNQGKRLTTRTIRRIVKEHLRAIGLNNNKLTAHSLRHSFATNAILNGAPLMQVKEAMRHKNIETTTIYAHLLDRISNGAEKYVEFS